jgi:hypothetical protein
VPSNQYPFAKKKKSLRNGKITTSQVKPITFGINKTLDAFIYRKFLC